MAFDMDKVFCNDLSLATNFSMNCTLSDILELYNKGIFRSIILGYALLAAKAAGLTEQQSWNLRAALIDEHRQTKAAAAFNKNVDFEIENNVAGVTPLGDLDTDDDI